MEKCILFMLPWIWRLDAASLPNFEPSFINIAGYPWTPNCQYESCHNSDQCGATPVRMNPNAMSHCYCDSSCLLYGDCCFDYFENCLGYNISDFSKSDKYKNIESTLLREKNTLQYKTCSGSGTGNLFWTIRSCSRDGVTDEDVLDCEVGGRNVIGGVPVTLIENPSITFANYYCAKCHGFERNTVRFWRTNVMCNNGIDLTGMSFTQVEKLILIGTCWVHTQPNPEDKPRLCYKDFTKAQPKTNGGLINVESTTQSSDTDTLEPTITRLMGLTFVTPPIVTTIAPEIYLEDAGKLCSLYVYPVKDENSTKYQNAHCVLSVLGKGALDIPLRCGELMLPPGFFKPTAVWWTTLPVTTALSFHIAWSKGPFYSSHTPSPVGNVNSFSMLFNFGENEMSLEISGRVVRTETRLCLREDEVFNIYSQKCVTLIWSEMDMRPVNGTCILKDKRVMDGTGQLYPHGAHIFTITLSARGKDTLMKKFVRKKMKRYFERFLSDRNDISHKVSVNLTNLMQRDNPVVAMNNVSVNKHAMYTYTANVESKAPVSTLINETRCLFRQVSMQLSHHNVKAFDFSLNNFRKNNAYAVSECDEYVSNSIQVCPDEHVPKMFQDVELITVRDSYHARLNRSYIRLDNIGFDIHYEDSAAAHNQTDIIVCVPVPALSKWKVIHSSI